MGQLLSHCLKRLSVVCYKVYKTAWRFGKGALFSTAVKCSNSLTGICPFKTLGPVEANQHTFETGSEWIHSAKLENVASVLDDFMDSS